MYLHVKIEQLARSQAEPEDLSGDPHTWNWDAVPKELRSTPVSTPNLATRS